jgi:hypothetical protein
VFNRIAVALAILAAPVSALAAPAHFVILRHFGTSGVPEPATWAMMIAGAGMVGGVLREHRARTRSTI